MYYFPIAKGTLQINIGLKNRKTRMDYPGGSNLIIRAENFHPLETAEMCHEIKSED